jgi:hypothetical protein
LDVGTESIETLLNILITPIYLFDIVNTAGSFGTHRCYQQGDTCTDVRARHATATEGNLTVMAYNDGTVRIAENNLGTHVNELVNKEQTTLEHLLMEQY